MGTAKDQAVLRHGLTGGLLCLALLGARSEVIPIAVPNGSFESPAADFVNTHIDSWQKADRPPEYPEGGGFLWEQLTGVFRNTAPGAADNLINIDGNQAMYLFAIPGVCLFQDADTVDGKGSIPTHAFSVPLIPGNRYTMTVGVLGHGGGMLEGVPLELAIYYRDDRAEAVPIGTTLVTNSATLFPDRRHFVDFSVTTPVVLPTDPWAGRTVGLRMRSLVDDARRGGYWDLDQVRLTREDVKPVAPQLAIRQLGPSGKLALTLESRLGELYDLLQSTDLNQWTPIRTGLPGTGALIEIPLNAELSEGLFLKVLARLQH